MSHTRLTHKLQESLALAREANRRRILFAGIEKEREGNVHFCGEATDLGFQGYMEGAVRSAERLAFHWPRL